MSGIPDFGSVDLSGPSAGAGSSVPGHDEWAKAFKETTGRGVEEATWETPEGIAVPPLATPSADGAGGLAGAGTTVACICGTDKDYAETASGLAAALRAAGATQVWLAGKPDLAVDGVDGYVYAGCDALAALHTVHEELGVKA